MKADRLKSEQEILLWRTGMLRLRNVLLEMLLVLTDAQSDVCGVAPPYYPLQGGYFADFFRRTTTF